MSSSKTHRVDFQNAGFPPLQMQHGANLSEHLDVGNSPLLFGCRTGICGTCLVQVKGDVAPPDEEELELLEVLAPNDEAARLACQVVLTSDIIVVPHPDAG